MGGPLTRKSTRTWRHPWVTVTPRPDLGLLLRGAQCIVGVTHRVPSAASPRGGHKVMRHKSYSVPSSTGHSAPYGASVGDIIVAPPTSAPEGLTIGCHVGRHPRPKPLSLPLSPLSPHHSCWEVRCVLRALTPLPSKYPHETDWV